MTMITMETDIELHDIVCELDTLPVDVLVEFVEQLDAHVADWEFTKACHRYFSREMNEHAKEELSETSDTTKPEQLYDEDKAFKAWNEIFQEGVDFVLKYNPQLNHYFNVN